MSESDENQLTVKVASGAVNEVTASYLVDEQQLEIRLRIPGDWPLHRIEIRDTKKVGVDDNRWRAWILGVQQTIWAQVQCPVKFFLRLVANRSDSFLEWTNPRWSGFVQEERGGAFPGSSRVCDMLFVSFQPQMVRLQKLKAFAPHYRLISVMDGSLPKKPCNTCKNRFHAACLFKVRFLGLVLHQREVY